ncbi:MAG: hypothetical protein N4A41_06450 [Crocinitomicaceae bacterium]|jgi:hypothetical protein|nr:hypothetical protein [Crocinitomicaceae bacterium]
MLSSLLKKRLSDEQLANVFINGLLEVIESSFPVLAEMINDDTAFVKSPEIAENQNGEFAMIVFAANMQLLQSSFDPTHANEIQKHVIVKLAQMNDIIPTEFQKRLKDYQQFISRINHPSKNLIYGMSKAIFAKYNLHQFQDEYFKRLAAPNPLFLKRLDEITKLFIWDWDAFFKRYKL